MGDEQDKYLNFRFPGQKPSEKIQHIIRKHWIIDVKIFLTLFMIGFIPLLVGITIEKLAWDGSFNDTFLSISMGFLVYFLLIHILTYIKWLNEELDIIIVTDERIVSHEQISLFHRQISEANIAQVQDVTGTQKGFMQSILHYGTLEIQTSSSDIFFIIKHVFNPYESARTLLDLRDTYLRKHPD